MSDYLLLKITALEHASANENCRTAEDILTVICDVPSSPTPTPTSTPTPTPQPSFNSLIRILIDNSPVSQNGITFNASAGDTLEYNSISSRQGVGRTTNLFTGNTQVGQVDFMSDYEGAVFRYTDASTGLKYFGILSGGGIVF